MNRVRLSVVMTVYNSEKYVKEAIDSVLNQSFKDFEFIIVDDGSKDQSVSIIKEYTDTRIKFLVNEKNYGICYSSNKGISEAIGEYIARIDSDDICHKDRFKKQVEFLDKHKNVFMCATWRNLLYSDGRLEASNIAITKHNEIAFMLLFGNPMITHSTVMLRREVYKHYKYSYERFIQAHDYKLWTQFVIDGNQIEIIPEILLDYRLNNTGITVTNTSERNKKEADTIKIEYLEAMNLDDKSKNILKKYITGAQVELYYDDFERSIVNWAKLFYEDVESSCSDGYKAISDIIWHILVRQKSYSCAILKKYVNSKYVKKNKLFRSNEGIKFIVKCLLRKNDKQ